MSEREILQVKEIKKSFGSVHALKSVSLTLREGEVISIVGENGAGKSTLMNVITGIYIPDSGEIFVEGEKQQFHSPMDAIKRGICIVHQEIANCPDITVAENIFMSTIVKEKKAFVDFKTLNEKAEELLKPFNSRIKPKMKMSELSISEQQIVEIATALSKDPKVIIFDEPTSSLTDEEVQKLFQIIFDLKEKGIGILYISHRMEEVFILSDKVVVLRDGEYVDEREIKEVTNDWVVSRMIGHTLDDYYPSKAEKVGEPILKVKNYNREGVFHDISFELRENEILGFSGLVGAGRSELMKSLVGLEKCQPGELELNSEKIVFKNYAQALKKGVVYLTEDRKSEGLFLRMNIQKNMSLLNLDKISGKVFVDKNKEVEESKKYSEMMRVRCSGLQQIVGTLSGGNQQKIMVANALSIEPKLIILDEPTRGIDVGAKAEIYKVLRELANTGVGIIVISSELPEIIGLCDRVCVMYEGKLCGEVHGEEMTEHNIMQLASDLADKMEE